MVRELSEERFRLIVALKEREDEADALHEANDRLLARMSELFDYVDRGPLEWRSSVWMSPLFLSIVCCVRSPST